MAAKKKTAAKEEVIVKAEDVGTLEDVLGEVDVVAVEEVVEQVEPADLDAKVEQANADEKKAAEEVKAELKDGLVEIAKDAVVKKDSFTAWWKRVGIPSIRAGKSTNRIYAHAAAYVGAKTYGELQDVIDRTKSIEENCKAIFKAVK